MSGAARPFVLIAVPSTACRPPVAPPVHRETVEGRALALTAVFSWAADR